jgi:hypothetical protein
MMDLMVTQIEMEGSQVLSSRRRTSTTPKELQVSQAQLTRDSIQTTSQRQS